MNRPNPQQDQGMELDPQILVQVQNGFIAESRIKEVQMEAAIQQLRMEVGTLQQRIMQLEAETADVEVVEDADADSQ